MEKTTQSIAEQRFRALMKEVIENTDYEDEIKRKQKEFGYDKPLDYDTLKKRAKEQKRARNSRWLKVAGIVLAVFILSSAMNIFQHSNVAMASRFEINNFMFSVRNGFFATDFQFNSISSGRELIIEKEEQIPIGRNFLSELKIPGHIPDGYNFLSLSITNNPHNEYIAFFLYESDLGNFLIIRQEKLTEFNSIQQITGIEKDFFIGDARLFYVPSLTTANNSLFVTIGSNLFQITGVLELDELIFIFEMLQ